MLRRPSANLIAASNVITAAMTAVTSSKTRPRPFRVAASPLVYREVLVFRYQEELSYEQIAEILEVPVSTIETRIFRAKKMLREKLDK